MIAYCSNVHAGPDWTSACKNLETYTVPIRKSLVASNAWADDEPMGIGLWFAQPAATEALLGNRAASLRDWLAEHRLIPFTMNGFPFGNFHQAIVKHQVYLPTWWDRKRFEYTKNLVDLMDLLLPSGMTGSISTLPLAWSNPVPTQTQLETAANHLHEMAIYLDRMLQQSGREIVIAIEPEPGCLFTDSQSLRDFFDRYLLNGKNSDVARRHLTVCHDICHAAVMREDQAAELDAYRKMGMRIGKVQVSSAIEIDWDKLSAMGRKHTFSRLQAFAEDRYLHQTHVSSFGRLVEDLPELMATIREPERLEGSWRIHFHVPIYLESLMNGFGTTQSEIATCIRKLKPHLGKAVSDSNAILDPFFTGHYEIETYAWSVLPPEYRGGTLVEDISREMQYFGSLLKSLDT